LSLKFFEVYNANVLCNKHNNKIPNIDQSWCTIKTFIFAKAQKWIKRRTFKIVEKEQEKKKITQENRKITPISFKYNENIMEIGLWRYNL
jgi:hypothetical protein